MMQYNDRKVKYYEPAFSGKAFLQGGLIALAVGTLAGLFLLGAAFGREEMLHRIPTCNGDEYIARAGDNFSCVNFRSRP